MIFLTDGATRSSMRSVFCSRLRATVTSREVYGGPPYKSSHLAPAWPVPSPGRLPQCLNGSASAYRMANPSVLHRGPSWMPRCSGDMGHENHGDLQVHLCVVPVGSLSEAVISPAWRPATGSPT